MTTQADTFRVAPMDAASRDALAGRGFDYRTVAVDGDGFAPWLQSVARGFQDGERSEKQIAASRERSGYRRITGVYDPTTPVAEAPVGSIASWVSPLTVPGGASIPACAISAVTVAQTHRRRGIARALLEGELRLAHAHGVPAAMLTVSESTLYGRYGFAPAAASASWRIETKRARWIGPATSGRVDFIPRARLRELIPALHERVRGRTAGEIEVTPGHWDGFAGTSPAAENAEAKRAVQYADADGEVRGLLVYSVKENHDDFTKATVHVAYLLAETDDAYAALWRFLLEMDLVAEVHAEELSVDEPLWWMIADQRAATITVRDHQYVRILDVKASLEARRFSARGSFVLEVDDPIGITTGRYLLDVDAEGAARVTADPAEVPAAAIDVALGVTELSAVFLGGVSAATLAAAGRVQTRDAAAAARSFGWHVAPRLSIWY